ncbi:flippase [Pseudomonas sp. Fl4BN1]|uniref:flippase n=1 Tax=Pseudomonas sp. Fl4BN1 TaxID=2697651 RepID=UPI00137703B9|nr:flippase [Pseudomonas sp. Fl4BN1]NBF09252.1 oligosaccharide flippase family protein [Pseudomonas sp. Fl4BN1]
MSALQPPRKPAWLNILPEFIGRHLDGRKSIASIVYNSGWLLFDRVVRLLLGLLVGAWVARYLGPTQYGELAYALAYIAFFQAIATLGLDGVVVRDISNSPESAGAILGTALSLRLMSGVVCWLSAVLGMAVINGIDSRSVILTALAGGTLIFQAADTIDLWFQSQSQVRRTVLAKLAACLISNGVKVMLILIDAPLISFAAVLAFDALIAALGLMVAYKLYPCESRWERVAATSKELLREGWPFMLSGLSIIVYMRIDLIMIKELIGEGELGVYAAVLPIATLGQVAPVILVTSLAPFVARKKAEGEQAYWNALEKIFQGFALVGWLACIFISIFSHLIVDLLLGESYSSGATVLAIYSITSIFISLGVAQWLWSLNEKKSRFYLYKTLAGSAVCVLGNFLVVSRFGLIGVAWVAVASQFVSAVLSNLFFAQKVIRLQISSIFFYAYIKNLIKKKY